MAEAKMQKQIDFVGGKLVQWKSLNGAVSYTWADFQASFLSAIARAKHSESCSPIEDSAPVQMLLLSPTISSLMPTPQTKAEFLNAQRSMKT